MDHAFDTKSQNITIRPEIPWRVEVGQKISFVLSTK